jgi:tetratricopeptide (TPR) repeat protein
MAAQTQGLGDGPEELLPLALSRPKEALTRARAILAQNPEPYRASVARQAIGLVLREFGDIDASVHELQEARRQARRSGSAERAADVLGALGFALVLAGRAQAGRAALNDAVRTSSGRERGRSLLRRGSAQLSLGHHREALADLNNAIVFLRAADDQIWQARALSYRASSHLALGSVHRAVSDLQQAEKLFTELGQELESVDAIAHRGLLAVRLGDLPTALAYFDEAAARFEALGTSEPSLSLNRCEALLAAGLPRDAKREADLAIERLELIRGQPTRRAELLLMAATSALADGQLQTALERATEAAKLFQKQGRHWWLAHARLVQLRATFASGPATPRMLGAARRCVDDLARVRSPEVPLARLTAGRLALAIGDRDAADDLLSSAGRSRHRGPAHTRAVAWLAEALRAEALEDERRVLHACRRGLDVLDENRSLLGSSELLAQSTAHGAELASLGQRHALRAGRPRRLLSWSERWRAIALAVPTVRPPDDERLRGDLAALREVTKSLSRAREQGLPTASLQRDQLRAERVVRARAMRALGTQRGLESRARPAGFDIHAMLDELGDDRLLELVDVDGVIQVLVCGSGVVRLFRAGELGAISREVDFARFALRRLAHGRSADRPTQAMDLLYKTGERLNEVLFAEARGHLGRGRVIVVPPGSLQAIPWALLPDLRHRVVNVAPSATSWLWARRSSHPVGPADGMVVLVRGPGLASQGAEVPAIARTYGNEAALTVLGDGGATAERVLKAMDGARLVHIAAHGSFRADSPMFSALLVDDGALTVYDVQRLRRGPRNIILSSCDSGVSALAGADEVLGLASSLIPLGTRGIVASVLPVNDRAAVPMMVALHRRLQSGAGLAAALRDARSDAGDDPVAQATALSFVSLGAD